MARTIAASRVARSLLDRPGQRLRDRRGFLTGAGKYGALLMGAAYVPSGTSPSQTGSASAQTGTEEFDVEEKGIVRVLGVVQRRSGLTRLQVKFRSPDFDFSAADRALIAGAAGEATDRRRPTTLGTYYRWVHAELTKNDPGRNLNISTMSSPMEHLAMRRRARRSAP